MNTYTISVVGAGAGGKLSIRGAEASDRYRLVAVADVKAEAREAVEAQWPHARVFPSHAAMFAECPTDVVCVSTYAPTHLPITRDALSLPLTGILVEKPLGDTARAGREILEAVRAKALPMAVPHGLLMGDHVREIIGRVRGGEIGELKLVEIENGKWDVINAGIHWLNFFVNLVGDEPVEYVLAACDASTRTYRDGMQVETVSVTLVQMKNGVRCVLHIGDDVRTTREGKGTLFRIVGTKGQIEFWGFEGAYLLVNEPYPSGRLFEFDAAARGNHRKHLDAMAAQMDAGAPDYAIADSSLRALELCEAAYLSNRRRCRVVFPLESFTPPEPTDWDPGTPYSGEGGGRDGRKL